MLYEGIPADAAQIESVIQQRECPRTPMGAEGMALGVGGTRNMNTLTVNPEDPFHPLADLFPLMDGEPFADLVADIKEHGQHQPIIAYENKVLDGRNRWRACQELGIEPLTEPFTGADPLAYVVSLNLKRRHLNESQRAMIAADIANMRPGERTDLRSIDRRSVSQTDAAKLLNVSDPSVRRAARVQREGSPELKAAVRSGAVPVSTASESITAETRYAFLKDPHWSPSAAVRASKNLDGLDEGVRTAVIPLVQEAGANVEKGIEVTAKVRSATAQEKREFVRLIESGDERDQNRAATWAFSTAPEPDPRLSIYRKCVLDLQASRARFPDDPEDSLVGDVISRLEQIIDRIRMQSKRDGHETTLFG